MQRAVCITTEEMALISASILFASRLSADKLSPKEWEGAQLALNDASMSLQTGGITSEHVKLICGCLEGVRRYTAKDRFIPITQRSAVMQSCALLMQKLEHVAL